MANFLTRKLRQLFSDTLADSTEIVCLRPCVQPVAPVDRAGVPFVAGNQLDLWGDLQQEQETAGNVALADFPDQLEVGDLWVIDQFSINSAAGGWVNGYIVTDFGNTYVTGDQVNCQALMAVNLLHRPIFIDGQVGIGVMGGAAADGVFMRARRVA